MDLLVEYCYSGDIVLKRYAGKRLLRRSSELPNCETQGTRENDPRFRPKMVRK
jgi:hypothetical protein